MKKFWILGGMCGMLLVACGKEETESATFKYQYTVNGCDTGEHVANSKDEHCQQLKDSSLNRFCAEGLRKEAFLAKDCGQW